MPDIAVHRSMGYKVYRRLGMKMDVKSFRFGLLGADPFLFCLPVVCHYSSIMHRKRTGKFLLEMAKRVRTKEQFAYLAGYLCHYALDSKTHPFIVSLSEKGHDKKWIRSMMHIAIEHRLDYLDSQSNERPPYPPDSVMEFFHDSVREVYGWKDSERKMKNGYRCMPMFYLFVRDRYGIFDKITGWTKGPAAMISSKSKICDGLDFSEFYSLCEESVEDAIQYIKCAYNFVNRKIGEEEFKRIIGNKRYL